MWTWTCFKFAKYFHWKYLWPWYCYHPSEIITKENETLLAKWMKSFWCKQTIVYGMDIHFQGRPFLPIRYQWDTDVGSIGTPFNRLKMCQVRVFAESGSDRSISSFRISSFIIIWFVYWTHQRTYLWLLDRMLSDNQLVERSFLTHFDCLKYWLGNFTNRRKPVRRNLKWTNKRKQNENLSKNDHSKQIEKIE